MVSKPVTFIVTGLLALGTTSIRAQSDSESERLEKLERAVEQLQKRNAELENEVQSLKKQIASGQEVDANGNQKPKMASDGKTLLEKPVVTEEKPPVFVVQRGPEIKLTLGGFIQANFEGGDVSAFEGRFGLTVLKDRFRLRRARINLTGDFAEQFDFKMEGDFENSDGISSNRTAFSATDIFVNWHRYPEGKSKLDSGKRHSVWNKRHPTRSYSRSSAACRRAHSRRSARLEFSFGENRSRICGRTRKIF